MIALALLICLLALVVCMLRWQLAAMAKVVAELRDQVEYLLREAGVKDP
jgi:hypothetical protein